MSRAIENLKAAQQRAQAGRPRVNGFAYLAEALRSAGVTRNVWVLPACQSLYLTADGPVVMQGECLVTGAAEVPAFDPVELVKALRTDQAGESSFAQFLQAAWAAGVVRYEVDFTQRTVSYFGCGAECYEESYPAPAPQGS